MSNTWIARPSLANPRLLSYRFTEHCVTTPDNCIIDKIHITSQKILVTIESRCFCEAMRGQRLVFLWYSIKGLGTNKNCCQNIKVWQSIKPFTGIIAEMKFFIGFQKSCSFLVAPLFLSEFSKFSIASSKLYKLHDPSEFHKEN